MAISAADVRKLREETGVGMMDCKKALEETNGDFEGAKDHLRKTVMKKAAKKVDRGTGEGRVVATISDDGTSGCLVSVECETDFAARNDQFGALMDDLSKHAMENKPADKEAMLAQSFGDDTVEGRIKASIGMIGENMRLGNVACYENAGGRIGCYIHHDDKQGVLINVTTGADGAAADALIKDIGMHIVSMRPQALSSDEIPAETIERERNIYLADEDLQKKPEEMREKIVDGKMKRFFADNTLLGQPFVKDDKKTVEKVVSDTLGEGSEIEAFALFRCGA